MRRSRPPRLLRPALAGLLALAVAACGSPTGSPVETSPPPARMSPVPAGANYNAADVIFAQETLRHLKQAVEMAQLAATRAEAADVKALAAKAGKDRGDVVILLDRWLQENEQPAPSAAPTAKQAGGRNGLATEQELATLAGVRGRPFDRLFLRMLIINNESATNLLNAQQWAGKSAPLMSIAHKLADDHTAELKQARRLLGR